LFVRYVLDLGDASSLQAVVTEIKGVPPTCSVFCWYANDRNIYVQS